MKELQQLSSEEFRSAVGPVNDARVLRRYLLQCEEVRQARRALVEGRITEETLRHFADGLMDDFERGVQFPHELALAAVAVMLERRGTRFAEDYLLDLARLSKIEEMHLAPRVAALSLREWHRAPKVLRKQAPPVNRLPSAFPTSLSPCPRIGRVGP